MLDCLRRHHRTHISASRGVADISCAAAYENDGTISRHLQALHQAERHEVTYMEAVCRRVKADIEFCTAIVYQVSDFFFVCYLRDKTTRL